MAGQVSYFTFIFRKIFAKYQCILDLGFYNKLINFLSLFHLALEISHYLLNQTVDFIVKLKKFLVKFLT